MSNTSTHIAGADAPPGRVLLIEDSDADAGVLQALLQYYGMTVKRTTRLSHALDVLAHESPECILLDLGLPDSTGLGTLERLLDRTRAVPVVILTGTSDEAMAVEAVACGAQDYLPKGLTDGRTLVRAIRYACERHRAEQSLRASEERFRTLVEHSADGIALLDRRGKVVYASPAVKRILGWEVYEFEGNEVFEFVYGEDRAEARESFAAVLSGSREQQLTERRYLCRDGSWRILEVSRRNRLADPVVGAIVVNYRDVTERRRLEEQVEQARRVVSLGRVAASVAHEFNNVLMGIQPFAESISKRAGNDKQLANVGHKILQGTQRGARLTTQILRYTNPAEPRLEPVDLAAWVHQFADEAKNLAPDRSLVFHAPDSLMTRADPCQLQQVAANLLVNARDATPRGGVIEVGVAPAAADPFIMKSMPDAERFVSLYVRDHGQGIRPDVLERIFEPLFTTKKHGGTGLGLAVAHQIVIDHGGHLLAQSDYGAGACFHVVLPRLGEDEA
jgi:PAS domain S-box-containing protein